MFEEVSVCRLMNKGQWSRFRLALSALIRKALRVATGTICFFKKKTKNIVSLHDTHEDRAFIYSWFCSIYTWNTSNFNWHGHIKGYLSGVTCRVRVMCTDNSDEGVPPKTNQQRQDGLGCSTLRCGQTIVASVVRMVSLQHDGSGRLGILPLLPRG